MRVIDWSINALNQVIALPNIRADIELGGNIDQDAMAWVFAQKGFREHVLYQPLEWHNLFHLRYNDWPKTVEPGDLLVHFAGLKGDNRVEAMNYWLGRVEREPENLTIPAEETNVPTDIEDYWALLRSVVDAKATGQKFVDDYSMDSIKDNTLKEKLTSLQKAVDDLRVASEEDAHEAPRLEELLDAVAETLKVAEDAQTAFSKSEEAKKAEAAKAPDNNNADSQEKKADTFSGDSAKSATGSGEQQADTSGDSGKPAAGKEEDAKKDTKAEETSSKGRFNE